MGNILWIWNYLEVITIAATSLTQLIKKIAEDARKAAKPCTIVIGTVLKADSPKTKLYLQSVLPVTDHYNMFKGHTSRWQVIPEINKGLVGLAEKEGATYIDLYSHFIDKQTGKMNTTYTNDGLHLLGKGYLKWVEIVKPYIGKK